METILNFLIVWFLISIPASLIIGAFLAMGKHPTEVEYVNEPEHHVLSSEPIPARVSPVTE